MCWWEMAGAVRWGGHNQNNWINSQKFVDENNPVLLYFFSLDGLYKTSFI